MSASPANPTTVLLAAACLMLGGVIAWEASNRDKVTVTPPPPPKLETPTAPREFRLPPIEHYRNFVSRPLFIQGRRPIPKEAPGPTPQTAPTADPSKIQLTGILDTPELGRIALLRSRDGKHHYRLHPGDTIEGWRLTAIAPDHVVLTHGQRRQVLPLRKPRPNAPVVPRRRAVKPALRRGNPFLQGIIQQKNKRKSP